MNKNQYATIGSIQIDPDTKQYKIDRGPTSQGYVYKNEENYYENPDKPCYIPELHDTIYTKNDFLELTRNNESIADLLFDIVDWQSPETLFDEWLNYNLIVECEHCHNYVIYGDGMENTTHCPYCNTKINN